MLLPLPRSTATGRGSSVWGAAAEGAARERPAGSTTLRACVVQCTRLPGNSASALARAISIIGQGLALSPPADAFDVKPRKWDQRVTP
eukprot:5219779-Prymnesium_polylepis.1